MRIEAVITCVNYSDFLEHTLPKNIEHLDGVVVVTSRDDRDTKRLCEKLGVNCVDTNVFYDKGDKFNKGRAINLGLSHLRHEDWLLHMDADILLPHRFRRMLEYSELDPVNIYGCDRVNVGDYENWMHNKDKAKLQWSYGYLVGTPKEFPIGSRLVHSAYGWLPIGFWQLWNAASKRKYPTNQGSAEHTDVLFALQWDRPHRVLLPELFVFHLESEVAPIGKNWGGRKTPKFEPKKKK